jgi:hypothetical protein
MKMRLTHFFCPKNGKAVAVEMNLPVRFKLQ